MADEKLTGRTESTDTVTPRKIHIVQGGQSWWQSDENFYKPVTDAIAALPAWQDDITGVSLTAGNNNIDTSQAVREPKDWKILDGSLSNTPDITSEFIVGVTQSTNWFITINTSIARSNLIVRWFGVILLMFLFGISAGQDLLPIVNGWKNLGKSNFLDSVIVQGTQSEGIPFFSGELLKTSSGLTYNTAASSLYLSTSGQLRFGSVNDRVYLVDGTALYLSTDDQIYLISDSVYIYNPSDNTNALRIGTLALRNEGAAYSEILSQNKLNIKSNDTLFLREKDGANLVICVNDTCFYVNDILSGSEIDPVYSSDSSKKANLNLQDDLNSNSNNINIEDSDTLKLKQGTEWGGLFYDTGGDLQLYESASGNYIDVGGSGGSRMNIWSWTGLDIINAAHTLSIRSNEIYSSDNITNISDSMSVGGYLNVAGKFKSPSIQITNEDTITGITDYPTGDSTIIEINSAEQRVMYAPGVGGVGSGLSNIVEDLTPQLGGDLDLNGNIITDAKTNSLTVDYLGSPTGTITGATGSITMAATGGTATITGNTTSMSSVNNGNLKVGSTNILYFDANGIAVSGNFKSSSIQITNEDTITGITDYPTGDSTIFEINSTEQRVMYAPGISKVISSANPYFYASCSDSSILVDITQNVYSSFGDSSMTQYVNEGGFVFNGDSVQIPMTGRYYVQFEVDFQGTATTSLWDGKYAVNGVIVSNKGSLSRTTSTNDIGSANMTTVLNLTANDWIKPMITNKTNSNDLTLINLDLIIKWDD